MKMVNRRFKLLDKIGSQVQRKTELHGAPTNRAERRRYEHALREAGVSRHEIDESTLFNALKERS